MKQSSGSLILLLTFGVFIGDTICSTRWAQHLKHFPLPKQVWPHELGNLSLNEPVLYHPQPFSFPGYPVVLYL